ncbi:hypothetical protein [Acinetobacter rathckeae]|uniref:hypothetical protein n=1 Tax=Acinetobacter rathckeae TaxID=2605272 RepID=UPI0018A2AEAF|nr:hypothetical protein [Acinetobacter rathckeae]MBF7695118.1 hypothetical protein [Acinetobacter rathckeae]
MQPQPRVFDKVGFKVIQTNTCNKLSDRAQGQLHYQVWYNEDQKQFGLSILKNESSGGFSAELIQVEDIIQSLQQLQKEAKPFHATAFKSLFIGKSVNNHCFLAAILVHQNIVTPHPETARLLEVHSDFELWSLTLEGLLVESESKPKKRQGKATTSDFKHITAKENVDEVHPIES